MVNDLEKTKKRRRTLSVSEEIYTKLMKHGRYKDTIGDIINRCIESHEKIIAKEVSQPISGH